VLQSLFGRDSLSRVVDENLAKEIEELPVEGCCHRDEILQREGDVNIAVTLRFVIQRRILTPNCFIAFTYFRDALEVSAFG
jgi:hypothetical protein